MESLQNLNFSKAIDNFKECSKILKNTNSSETIGFLLVLKRLSQAMFYDKKYKECHEVLRSSIDLSSNLYHNKPEMIFQYKRNLLSFYLYTDINAASELVDYFLKEQSSPYQRYFIYAAGPIKIMNGEYSKAKEVLDKALTIGLSKEYEGNILNNLAVLKWSLINTFKKFKKIQNNDERTKIEKEFFNNNSQCFLSSQFENLSLESEEIQCLLLMKLAISTYGIENNNTESKEINKNEDVLPLDQNIFSQFCSGEDLLPKSAESENMILNYFKYSSNSSKTISNMTEKLFEMGDKYIKPSGFWMKAGLQNKNNKNLPRHLIICALIYSQLGQTMMAEGMYRSALGLLNNSLDNESQVNLPFCLNMYGRLLLRDVKRQDEGMKLIENSEKLEYSSWQTLLPKLHYLDFDFE